jgi:hypothetical protein
MSPLTIHLPRTAVAAPPESPQEDADPQWPADEPQAADEPRWNVWDTWPRPIDYSRRYVAQGVKDSLRVFGLPLVLAPLVVPRPLWSPVTILAGGLFYANACSNEKEIAFRPHQRDMDRILGNAVALSPYVPAYSLHAHLRGMQQFEGLSREIGAGWHRFCAQLPRHSAAKLRDYPIQFVAGRLTFMVAASSIGNYMKLQYEDLDSRGARLRPRQAGDPPARPWTVMDPAVAFVAGVTFSLPAALSLGGPMKSMGLGPVHHTRFVTGKVALAAFATQVAAVVRQSEEL